MIKAYVFYAGRLYAEHTAMVTLPRGPQDCDPEVYNGGYLYFPKQFNNTGVNKSVITGWYRMDKTPLVNSEIPNELKLLLLIMGVN